MSTSCRSCIIAMYVCEPPLYRVPPMPRGIIDAMYFKLNAAFLKNEREKAAMFLGMLQDSATPQAILGEIGPIHFARFLHMAEEVHGGTFRRPRGGGEAVPVLSVVPTERSRDEATFHVKIMGKEGRGKLFGALDIQPNASLVHELELGAYGRVDFLVREGRTWHAIEVKINRAEPEIVSQVDKYVLALELEMSMGLHDVVKAAVLAGSFSPYAASELSRMGVAMLIHDGTIEGIRKLA